MSYPKISTIDLYNRCRSEISKLEFLREVEFTRNWENVSESPFPMMASEFLYIRNELARASAYPEFSEEHKKELVALNNFYEKLRHISAEKIKKMNAQLERDNLIFYRQFEEELWEWL